MHEWVKVKQVHFRELICCQEDDETGMRKISYKEERRDAKKTIAEAKYETYKAIYKCIDMQAEENGIFRLVDTREKRRREFRIC